MDDRTTLNGMMRGLDDGACDGGARRAASWRLVLDDDAGVGRPSVDTYLEADEDGACVGAFGMGKAYVNGSSLVLGCGELGLGMVCERRAS